MYAVWTVPSALAEVAVSRRGISRLPVAVAVQSACTAHTQQLQQVGQLWGYSPALLEPCGQAGVLTLLFLVVLLPQAHEEIYIISTSGVGC